MRKSGEQLKGRTELRVRERRVSGPVAHGRGVDPGELAAAEMESLKFIARRFSINADDADEAVQRGLEILLRRAETLESATAAAWLRTVIKHEAFAVRADRMRSSGADPETLSFLPDVHDTAESAGLMDRLNVATEALSRIKPGEAEALLLQAEGLSYKDIASEKGWTYTKVNRLINEGAKAFRARVSEIDSGITCVEIRQNGAKVLQADHRRHLARCSACRAEVVAERRTAGFAALVVPVLLAMPLRLGRAVKSTAVSISDRATSGVIKAQYAAEAVSAGKVAAVAASAAAIAGGGVVATHTSPPTAHAQRASQITSAPPNNAASLDVGTTQPSAADEGPSTRKVGPSPGPTTVTASEAPAAEFDPGASAASAPAASASSPKPSGQPRASKAVSTPEFGP